MADGDLRLLTVELQAAMARIQRLSDDYWHILDATCGAMEDSAWMGPAARRFGTWRCIQNAVSCGDSSPAR